MRAGGSAEPASITPRQSMMAPRAASIAAGGQASHRLLTTNSAIWEVARTGPEPMAASLRRGAGRGQAGQGYHRAMSTRATCALVVILTALAAAPPAAAQLFFAD